jgi:hypothetical protein
MGLLINRLILIVLMEAMVWAPAWVLMSKGKDADGI